MRIRTMTRFFHVSVGLLAAFFLAVGTASAAEFFLRAEAFTQTMPDTGEVITMWGYAQDSAFGAMDGVLSAPGPRLVVPPGDTTLIVHLDNNLSVPTSIVIAGQIANMVPVKFTDATGRQRARAFTQETPALNGTAVDYVWTSITPGSYLYSSGSHPAVQVQMGLYGAVTQDAGLGEAYAGVFYDREVMLLHSEIDPVLHQAVALGTFGTAPMTSTIAYQPKYFAINGEPYSATTAPIDAGGPGDRVLLRFLNAGLRTHVPVLLGMHMSLIAEDGNLYPYPREQYSAALPAGKTRDAIIVPAFQGMLPIFDRTLDLTNGGTTALTGGLLRILRICPLAISVGPADVSVCEGGNAVFTATAAGAGVIHYQWSKDGLPVGTDSATLTLAGVLLADDGAQIAVQVTDDCNTLASAAATLTVTPGQPAIVAAPANVAVCPGSDAVFNATASGTGVLSYQWFRQDGVAPPVPVGTNSATLTIAAVTPADDGAQITVQVTDACGSATSAAATLTVHPGNPTITVQPASTTVLLGADAVFTVTATGSGLLHYQWFKGATAVGTDSSMLTLTAVQCVDHLASISCVVSDDCGLVLSMTATLTITGCP